MPDRLTPCQAAHPSQEPTDSLGTGRRSEQSVTNEGKFKLSDMAVGGRTPFPMPPPMPGASGLRAATRRSDPSPSSTYLPCCQAGA